MPIINPLDQQLMDTIDAYRVLSYQDKDAIQYIEKQSQHTVQSVLPATDFTLHDIIIHGLKDEVKAKTEELLQTTPALDIIDQIIIPALNQVGDDYEKNRIFLP